jgi:5'-3' exonuclease
MKALIAGVAAKENKWITEGVFKKLKMNAYGRPSQEVVSDVDKALNIMNSLPLTWKVERCIASRTEDGWVLNEDWKTKYYEEFLWAATPGSAVKEWLHGIQWILNYYTGGPVDMLWYYPWYLPPLFQDISAGALEGKRVIKDGPNPITPIAQLIMVLPVESYALLPRALRRMPIVKPEFYPSKWGFFSAGRRQLWECEPMIPMLPFGFVKKLLRL